MTRSTIAVLFALGASGCASAPVALVPSPVPPTYQQKLAAIIRLEDQRSLRDPAPVAAPPVAPVRGRATPAPTPPPPAPDLIRYLTDSEGRVRRRAALAVGRVGRAEGVVALLPLLNDGEVEVRQMAAFAIGLIGDKSGVDPLLGALADPSPLVKGAAAEGLGLIGEPRAATAVARMAADLLAGGALTMLPVDADDSVRDTPAAAYRLGVYALVRMKSFEGLATAALDASGQPRSAWWPIAYALQRLEDQRALPALLTLARDPHPYARAFAAKGLGAMKDKAAVAPLIALVSAPESTVAIEAIRSLGRQRDVSASASLTRLLQKRDVEPHVRLEAVTAIGAVGGEGVGDLLIDLLGDPAPSLRAAAIRALAQLDPQGFMTVLSGLDEDTDWSVRAALASSLATLPENAGLPRLRIMLDDQDARVIASVLAAIAKLKPADAGALLIARLQAADAGVRSAAAQAIGELKPAGAAPSLAQAYTRGLDDATYAGRASVLTALTAYGAAAATPTLTTALEDKEWAVRVRAAALLTSLDPGSNAEARIGLAPAKETSIYTEGRFLEPPFSTEASIETERGTIRVELAVLDAPLTVANFVALARQRFFDGTKIHRVVPNFVIQAGDPRGDGEGTPGYTIRDELHQRPYLRGTVGMALDWKDTGGSQFFITHTPQPHLDARYTVFGRVLSGMDVVDQLQQWDVIRRITIWDGSTPD